MSLLVAQDRDRHVLGDRVEAVRLLDDPCVVLDRAGLGLDHAADHVDHVGLLAGRLQKALLGREVLGSGHDPVELLDPVGALLRVAELLLDVLGVSQSKNAYLLIPAEHRSLIRWRICGK